MRCAAFLRVSTDDQALGISAQRAAIERWASGQHEVIGWFEDVGVSGATPLDKCPGLMAALAAAPKGGALVVARTDRLARDIIKAATVEALLKRKGARLISADGVGNGDGPEAALIRTIISAAAVYERALLSLRTKAAMAVRRAQGRPTSGTPPYGWAVVADHLVAIPAEQAVLERVHAMRAGGMGFEDIAVELARLGVVSRAGTRIPRSTVARWLSRPSIPSEAVAV